VGLRRGWLGGPEAGAPLPGCPVPGRPSPPGPASAPLGPGPTSIDRMLSFVATGSGRSTVSGSESVSIQGHCGGPPSAGPSLTAICFLLRVDHEPGAFRQPLHLADALQVPPDLGQLAGQRRGPIFFEWVPDLGRLGGAFVDVQLNRLGQACWSCTGSCPPRFGLFPEGAATWPSSLLQTLQPVAGSSGSSSGCRPASRLGGRRACPPRAGLPARRAPWALGAWCRRTAPGPPLGGRPGRRTGGPAAGRGRSPRRVNDVDQVAPFAVDVTAASSGFQRLARCP